ncbi:MULTISPECIES: asparagine synthase (glutamine-hydrolyzing) [Chromobacterium]
MTDIIRHRGPDDEGFFIRPKEGRTGLCLDGEDTQRVNDNDQNRVQLQIAEQQHLVLRVGLSHRRLSIVDLSIQGHQPMSYANGRYWISYNGEVYNYVELRTELVSLGYVFQTKTDTEVILAAYAEWGQECLSRFNGMFAFIIYDSLVDSLFVARDRFGVKPLYYMRERDGSIFFASEIKQFSILNGWDPKLDRETAYDFLAFSILDHTSKTLFQNVFQLPPGHQLFIDCKRSEAEQCLKISRWYSLSPQKFEGSYYEACNLFQNLFEDSVRLRMRADVPLGSCLSGGLDSSSIVGVVNHLLQGSGAPVKQHTFSACSEFPQFSEKKWIELAVAKTGSIAHYCQPNVQDVFEQMEKITWHQDEPFGSTSINAQWHVFQMAAEAGVKVMLDGQGSDEQLAGYHSFFTPYLNTLLKQGKFLQLAQEISAMHHLHGYGFKSLKYLANGLLPEVVKDKLKSMDGRAHAAPMWLNIECLSGQNPFMSPDILKSVRAHSLTQLTQSNLQMLLHWEDRNSMAHSLESRVPFLDYRLVEFTTGLPDEYKINKAVTKRILRDSMEEYLPDKIKNRYDKLGFVTPEQLWLRKVAPEMFRAHLDKALDQAGGVFQPDNARQFLENMIDGRTPFNFQPWRIINFGCWMDVFGVKI